MKRFLPIILLLITFLPSVYYILTQLNFYSRPFDYATISSIYSESQYITGAGSSGIGDDGLYAFAGKYLITGGDPVAVNFENPPLGKYLIGVSILLFNNENMIYIFYGLIILLLTFLLGMQVYKNKITALCCMVVLSLSRLFLIQYIPTTREQFSVTLLDLPLTLFVLLGIYFFLKTSKNSNYYFAATFFLGCAFVTKFFPGVIFFIVCLTVYVWFTNRKKMLVWLSSLLLIPLLYLLSYSMYFVYHPSLVEFINFQKYLISWRLGNPLVVGNIFRVLFLGKYKSWWSDELLIDQEWQLTLPILVILAMFGTWLAVRQKEKELLLICSLVSVFILYLGIASVGVARYLVPILPLLAIIAVRPLVEIINTRMHAKT